MSRPPLLPPRIASFSGRVHFSLIKYSAEAAKSSKTFCFLVRFPALCHSSPNSPPPRIFATTKTPPRSNQSRRVNSKRSEEHTSELQSPDHLVCRLLLEKKKRQHT